MSVPNPLERRVAIMHRNKASEVVPRPNVVLNSMLTEVHIEKPDTRRPSSTKSIQVGKSRSRERETAFAILNHNKQLMTPSFEYVGLGAPPITLGSCNVNINQSLEAKVSGLRSSKSKSKIL